MTLHRRRALAACEVGIAAAAVVAAISSLTLGCVVRDETVPETYVSTDLPTLTGESQATFVFHADEPGASFRCALHASADPATWEDDTASPCESPYTTPNLADGEHTFAVAAVDVAGNADATPASVTWVIDSNLPTLAISGPAALTNVITSEFLITASKPVQAFLCAIDDAPLAPCSDPTATTASYTYAPTEDGTYVLHVQATDAVGYTASKSHAWQLDATAPTITVGAGPAAVNNLNNIAITFVASEPVTGATCSYDNGAALSCNNLTFSKSNVAEGQHSVKLATQDAAGNGADFTVTWRTDKTKPQLVVDTQNGKWSVVANETTKVVATGLSTTIAAGQVKTWGTLPTTLGDHAMTVTGTDTAGNVNTAVGHYCVDNAAGTLCD